MFICRLSVGRCVAGGRGGAGSLPAAAGAGGGAPGGGVAAGLEEPQRRLVAVGAGEQPGVLRAGRQQRGGTETAELEPGILILKPNCLGQQSDDTCQIFNESEEELQLGDFLSSFLSISSPNGEMINMHFSEKALHVRSQEINT